MSRISKEESKREVQRRWLKEVANETLPFVILKPQLDALKDQIVIEEKIQSAAALIDYLNNASIRASICDVFSESNVDSPFILADKVLSVLESSVQNIDGEMILNLSKNEQMSILAKISSVAAFDTADIIKASKEIDASLARLKDIRSELDKSDESGAESYFETKEKLLTKKSDLLKQQLELEREIDNLVLEKNAAENAAKKAQQQYENYLKTKSVNDVTAKALLAFSDLQKRLYKKYIADVERNFQKSFNSLINKSDLIDGIIIDEQLQVYPYKNQTFKRSGIVSILAENGANGFISQLGNAAYEAYLDDNSFSEELTLPVEVKKKLSAGETQIFIMALYQALSSLNKVNVPYIIDTPFARIDTEHRQNILNNFFMKLSGQMIILSTDEEIVGDYKKSIEDNISNLYTIKHEEGKGTRICAGTYFPEAVL